MRLICPGCRAAYEIPDAAVPAAGREVQCSACAHSWYQLPASGASGTGAAVAELLPPDEFEHAGGEAPLPDPRPAEDRLDPSVLEVLRSEAAREAAARRRETPAVAPPAQRLPARAPRQPAAGAGIRDRLARLKEAEAAATEPNWQAGEETSARPAPAEASRKDVAAASPAVAAKPAAPPAGGGKGRALATARRGTLPAKLSSRDLAVIAETRHRAGFRLGFGATAGLAAAAVTLFLAAPALIERLPATEPVLAPVVAGGEVVRTHLRTVIAEGALLLRAGAQGAPPPG